MKNVMAMPVGIRAMECLITHGISGKKIGEIVLDVLEHIGTMRQDLVGDVITDATFLPEYVAAHADEIGVPKQDFIDMMFKTGAGR